MKTLRFLAAILLLISGVWHVSIFFRFTLDGEIINLIVGIIYFIIGLLLFTKKRFALYLGLLPLIMFVVSFIVMRLEDMDLTMRILLLIDVVVISCCTYLIIKQKKVKA
jgi:hypothetical protein